MNTVSFPGVKWPEHGVDHPSGKVNKAIDLSHLWAFVACYRVTFNFLPLIIVYNITQS